MKLVLTFTVLSLFSVAAQAAPQSIIDTAISAIGARCDADVRDLMLVSESVQTISIDQGQYEDLHTLGFEVMNGGNDNDQDLIEVEVLDARIANPTAGIVPTVTKLTVYGLTKCN